MPVRGLDDLAALLHTSRTTGKPEGAMLSHRNQLVNATQGAELVPLGPGDRLGMLLPLFHANAQVVTTLIPIMIECEIVMWERFSASKFWQTVAELEPASLSAVPTILAAVLHAPGHRREDLAALRDLRRGPAVGRAAGSVPATVWDPHPRGLWNDRDELHRIDQPASVHDWGRSLCSVDLTSVAIDASIGCPPIAPWD
ncbi:MAG: AMP-binding protein [Solirubrobacteraceae bacterium]